MLVFLFTDIEKSTQLWEKHRAVMVEVISRHDAILTQIVQRSGGKVIKHTGDGIFAVFNGGDPLRSALEIQTRLAAENWGEVGELRIRMAFHAGEAEPRGEDYFGPVINRTARLMTAAWGGQILISEEAMAICPLPEGATYLDLGSHLLPDLGQPQRIYQLRHRDLPLQSFPTLRTLSARPHNLPVQLNDFIGRDDDLVQIKKSFGSPGKRILTIVGPGGMGKTRLALQVGADLIEHYRDGVYFVPLDALSIASRQFLIFTIANALQFPFYSREDPAVQLIDYLRGKNMLIIMDNFEHLTGEASLLAEIATAAPNVNFLVTSRERLRLQGEATYELSGLHFPRTADDPTFMDYGATRFFLQCARACVPDYILPEVDRPELIRLFELTGGMPLCIEISATWLRRLPLADIIRGFKENADFLETTLQDVPKRHRSLRAVFNYSWDLLSTPERQLLSRLSIFSGGGSRDAVESVGAAALQTLLALTDKSLIRRTAAGRYEMHLLVRQFAREKLHNDLREESRTGDAHAAFYRLRLAALYEDYQRFQEERYLTGVSAEIENIRAAWLWAIHHDQADAAVDIILALHDFYIFNCWYPEAERLLSDTAALLWSRYGQEPADAASRSALGRIITRLGSVYRYMSRFDEAEALLKQALTKIPASENKAHFEAIRELSSVAFRLGHFDEALYLARLNLEHWQKANDQPQLGLAHNLMGNVYYEMRRFDDAIAAFEQGLAIHTATGNNRGRAESLNNIGVAKFILSDYPAARDAYEQSLAFRRSINDRRGISVNLNNLGMVEEQLGNWTKAAGLFLEALAIKREIGDKWGIANTLYNLGGFSTHREDFPAAKRYFRESLAVFNEVNAQPKIMAVFGRVAQLFDRMGNQTAAAELLCFLDRQPVKTNFWDPIYEDILNGFPPELRAQAATAAGAKEIGDYLTELIGPNGSLTSS